VGPFFLPWSVFRLDNPHLTKIAYPLLGHP
jgi:hypothetical protein